MTTITIQRWVLSPALGRAAQIPPARSPIQIMACALMEAGPAGLVTTVTDMDVVLREQVDDVVHAPFRACVDIRHLHAFVHGAVGDDVALRLDDEERLAVRCGRAACRLPTFPADDYPIFVDRYELVEFEVDGARWAAALRSVAPSMSDDQTRRYLNGAYLDANRVVSTDGHRLATIAFADDPPSPAPPNCIIPSATANRLVPLLRNVTGRLRLGISASQFVVTAPTWTLRSKLVDGTFPDWRRIVPQRQPHPLIVERAALRHATILAMSVTPGQTRQVQLGVEADSLSVASRGDNECRIEIAMTEEPPARSVSFGLNGRYLVDALEALDCTQVEIHVARDNPVWFCRAGETENENGVLVMPVR